MTAVDHGGVVVLIPAYAEEAAIGRVVTSVREAVPGADVVVIDDGSLDETASRARAAGATVLRHPMNLGYGVALQTGYKWALRRGYAVAAQQDADGQHEAEDLPRILAPVVRGEVDVCLGSRFLAEDGATPPAYRAGIVRRLGMRIFGAVASLATGTRITDPTSGFQALDASVLEFFCDDRYPFDYPDADQLITLHRAGFRIREVGVRMYENEDGRSMHGGPIKPFYYVITMGLAILVALLHERVPRPARPAKAAAGEGARPSEAATAEGAPR